MNFKPISPKWNIVDSGIYAIEKSISKIIRIIRESRMQEPNVEEMIAAETQHLRTENEEYKKLQYPLKLHVVEDKEYCPRCKKEIPET